MNGIIVVNKPKGFTSFDVVAKLRGMTHQKKIGHTGTLDPDATGVLPVCMGNATRVCELLADSTKIYEAVMILGAATDTEDSDGKITDLCYVNHPRDEIISVIKSFEGEYEQVPPMFSAKKINGQKLYDLARQGVVVQRKPSHVRIESITVNSIEDKDITQKSILDGFIGNVSSFVEAAGRKVFTTVSMTVECSKGTYIRSLCRDIGEKLSDRGCMISLKRIKAGPFIIEEALGLEEIQKLCDTQGAFLSALKSVDSVFSNLPKVRVKEEGMKALLNGNELPLSFVQIIDEAAFENDREYRIYDKDNNFKAIYYYSKNNKTLKTKKMFL